MNFDALLILCGNVLFDVAGQLTFKAASSRADHAVGLRRWLRLFAEPLLWLGIALFAAEAFLWLAFMAIVPLGQAVMVASVNIVSVMIGARLVFSERLTRRQGIAIALIAFGVMLAGWRMP